MLKDDSVPVLIIFSTLILPFIKVFYYILGHKMPKKRRYNENLKRPVQIFRIFRIYIFGYLDTGAIPTLVSNRSSTPTLQESKITHVDGEFSLIGTTALKLQ